MIAVLQRVSRAKVTLVDRGEVSGEIRRGLVVLLGVSRDDEPEDALLLAKKIAELRIMGDAFGKMNLSTKETGGAILVVSQFTLLADYRKGRRPSFTNAAPPEVAIPLYEKFLASLREEGVTVAAGVFQAEMEVELVNDGPVTIVLDSRVLRGPRHA